MDQKGKPKAVEDASGALQPLKPSQFPSGHSLPRLPLYHAHVLGCLAYERVPGRLLSAQELKMAGVGASASDIRNHRKYTKLIIPPL